MTEIYIFDAIRTPRGKGRPAKNGKPGGALSTLAPHKLVTQLIDAVQSRSPGSLSHVNRLTLGCVGQVGAQGGHIALVSRLASQLPDDVAVRTINNYCVSGLSAVMDGALWAGAQTDYLTLAGGVESLSQVGFLADKASYYSDPAMVKSLKWAPPILGAELIASLEGYSKADLDSLTFESHQRAAKAWDNGHYDNSVVAIYGGEGELLLNRDELIRADMTMDKLASFEPAFAQQGALGFDDMMLAEHKSITEISYVHSIANCPGMADGAALVLLGSKEAGARAGLKPRAKIKGFSETTGDPVLQFTAGFTAMNQVLSEQNISLGDMDRIEFMEAFAAIPLKFRRDYEADPSKVNVNGGHLAMGHPMGATGAILLTSLIHELERSDTQTGLVVAHAGGGIGTAMIVERV